MFGRPRRDVSDANFDPGIEKMMEYAKKKRLDARLPPVEHVSAALKKLFKYKYETKSTLQDNQAHLALQSLRYVSEATQSIPHEDDRTGPWPKYMAIDTFKVAVVVLNEVPREPSIAHAELARLFWAMSPNRPVKKSAFRTLISALCYTGDPHGARDLLFESEKSKEHSSTKVSELPTEDHAGEAIDIQDVRQEDEERITASRGLSSLATYCWPRVLREFAQRDDEVEMLRTLEIVKQRGGAIGTEIIGEVIALYSRRDDVEQMKTWWAAWYTRFTVIEKFPDPAKAQEAARTVRNVLAWCLTHDVEGFGRSVVRDLMTTSPPKLIWDEILVWALGLQKSVDEIGRMLNVMETSNEGLADRLEWRLPDITTINRLVESAISAKDPYMAERLISLGRDRGLQPDAKTLVLQMDYRLSVGDIDGTLIAYNHLQAQNLSSDQDVPTVNRLIVALCASKRHDFDTIMNIVADLSDRQADFEPQTVAILSILHLKRDELHDVIDLLSTHAHTFSSTGRASVRQAMVDFCLDDETPVGSSWDAYTIIRGIFDELPREPRAELMKRFFGRRKADMAVQVFNHMRAHTRADTIPDTTTYVAAFLGCARLRDLESLEVLHNQLKLDYHIDVDTYVRNALIIGYTACGNGRQALSFWDDIVASREGPSYNSIHVALRACEKSPFGDLKAKEIWTRLRKNNLELDRNMWASYIGALAGNGDNQLAISTLDEAEEKHEVVVDALILGSLFDAAPGPVKKFEIERWARESYPDIWSELFEMGESANKPGVLKVHVDRSVSP